MNTELTRNYHGSYTETARSLVSVFIPCYFRVNSVFILTP